MTEKEVFQALLDGKTIEKIYTSMSPSLFKIINGKLMVSAWNNDNFGNSSVVAIFTSNKLRIYQEKKTIVIDGKTIEISEESYNELKRSLT